MSTPKEELKINKKHLTPYGSTLFDIFVSRVRKFLVYWEKVPSLKDVRDGRKSI